MPQQVIIQIILIVALLFIGIGLTRSAAGARHQAVRRLLVLLFVVFAVVAVLLPDVLTRVARLVGVGRGADLLLYILVIAFLGFLASSFRKTAQLEDRITQLSRAVALLTVQEPPRSPDAGPEGDMD